jgi:hypothetical protein
VTSQAKRRLEADLGAEVAALNELSEADAADLGQLVFEARKTERKLLIKSINETIAALPRIFRGPVRAIAFGGLK